MRKGEREGNGQRKGLNGGEAVMAGDKGHCEGARERDWHFKLKEQVERRW